MLQDSRIVREPENMVRIQLRQVVDSVCGNIVLLCRPGLQAALESRALKARHILARRLGPDSLARVEICPFPHGVPFPIVIQ